MGKCLYCSKEHHIEDFFTIIKNESEKGEIKTNVEVHRNCRMYMCPSCDTILGFSEYRA